MLSPPIKISGYVSAVLQPLVQVYNGPIGFFAFFMFLNIRFGVTIPLLTVFIRHSDASFSWNSSWAQPRLQ